MLRVGLPIRNGCIPLFGHIIKSITAAGSLDAERGYAIRRSFAANAPDNKFLARRIPVDTIWQCLSGYSWIQVLRSQSVTAARVGAAQTQMIKTADGLNDNN